jgi:O-antigen/teichoic acid export membrane protein
VWGRLLVVAVPFGLIGFALNWSQKIDTVILSLYRTDDVLGWYNAAYSLILGASIISNSFNVALYPTMSKEYALSPATVQVINKRICRYLFMTSLPITIGLALLGPAFVSVLYGPEFLQAAVPLTILAWSVPLIFLSEFLRYRALAGSREKEAAIAILVASLVNIILNLIFIPTYGLVAAAVTTVLTEALLVIIYLWKLRAEISLLSIGNGFWKPALAAAVMAGGLLLFGVPSLLPAIALGGVIYLGTLILIGGVSAEETILVRELVRKLPPSASHS